MPLLIPDQITRYRPAGADFREPTVPPEEALLAGIYESWDDDTGRLVLADWYEENGQRPRAMFVRLQVWLARSELTAGHRARMVRRVQNYLRRHKDEWLGELLRVAPRWCWKFERGVPTPRLCASDPGGKYLLAMLGACPHVFGVPHVNLSHNGLTAEAVAALAACPHLARVRSLDLYGGPGGANVNAQAVAALATSPHAVGLTRLNLDNNWLPPEAAAAIAASTHFAGLTELSLWRNRVGTAGARALASSPFLARLTRLVLANNDIGEENRVALRAQFGERVSV